MSGRILPARARQAFHTSARLLNRNTNPKPFGYRTAERAEEGKRRERYADPDTGRVQDRKASRRKAVLELALYVLAAEGVIFLLFGGPEKLEKARKEEEERRKKRKEEKTAASERSEGCEQDGGGGTAA